MSIQVTLSFETQEDLMAFFSKGATTVTEVKEVPKAPKAAKVEKAEKPASTQPVSETVTTETTPAASAPSEPAADSPSEPEPVTYDQVAAVVISFSKKHGRPAAVELFKPFGITALPSATQEQYAPIKAAFEAAL